MSSSYVEFIGFTARGIIWPEYVQSSCDTVQTIALLVASGKLLLGKLDDVKFDIDILWKLNHI